MISGQCIKVLAHWAMETTRVSCFCARLCQSLRVHGQCLQDDSVCVVKGPSSRGLLASFDTCWVETTLHDFCCDFVWSSLSVCLSPVSPLDKDPWCSIRVSNMASSYCMYNRCSEIRPHPQNAEAQDVSVCTVEEGEGIAHHVTGACHFQNRIVELGGNC